MKDSPADAPRLVPVPAVRDPRGCLGFLQHGGAGGAVPFPVRRVYWIYDIRGARVHTPRAVRGCHELMVLLSGSCRVTAVDRSGTAAEFRLNSPDTALLIPEGTWRGIDELATNSVILVLASDDYRPDRIIRDYSEFLKLKDS